MQQQNIENLINNGYEFDMNLYFNRGMQIFKETMGQFVGYTAIYLLISIFGGSLASIIVSGPLMAGFYIVANDIVRDEKPTFSKFFSGFNIFLPLFLANLIVGIFSALGFVLLIIPGIYLSVAYTFTIPFVIFLKMDFWDAMEASRKLITRNFWPFLGFVIILLLINVVGLIMLGVGVLFTLPATICMTYAAFEDIVGKAVNQG